MIAASFRDKIVTNHAILPKYVIVSTKFGALGQLL